MLFVFLLLAGFTFVCFFVSRKRYDAFLKEFQGRKLQFRGLLPLGLYLGDMIAKRPFTAYDRRLLSAFGELYGADKPHIWLKIHKANIIILLILVLLFSTLTASFSKPDISYAVFSVILAGCAVWLPNRDLRRKVEERRLSIQLDFPDFINRLALLINAGMTVQRAWERAASGDGRESPLYRELQTALLDIKAGKPEHSAYEEFAKRCRIPEITRFISVILQNLRKGNTELVPILRVFSAECWELRKNTAKRCGEEASTKLLLPMMLMFIAILIIVGTPAVLSLQGI